MPQQVKYKDILLAYEKYGSGKNVFVCFHGNDRSPKDFEFLGNEHRCILSIYLFFHGSSTFSEERLKHSQIKSEGLVEMIKLILQKENVTRFHLLAYSQGGRFALCIYPFLAENIVSFTLIAPDGLNDKNFYAWSQRQGWARALFRRWIKKPQELLAITRFLVKLHIIHPKMIEFMEHYTSQPDVLARAYKTWAGFRRLRPNYKALEKNIIARRTEFLLIVGEYDAIITAKSAIKFMQKIKQPHLAIIPFGHDVFKPHILDTLKTFIDEQEVKAPFSKRH